MGLLSTSYQYLGQMQTAERLMREAFAIDSVNDYLAYSKREWIGFLLARGRAAEALETARTLAASAGRGGRLVGEMGAARALLALDRLDEARQAFANAEREQQAVVGRQHALDPADVGVEPRPGVVGVVVDPAEAQEQRHRRPQLGEELAQTSAQSLVDRRQQPRASLLELKIEQ